MHGHRVDILVRDNVIQFFITEPSASFPDFDKLSNRWVQYANHEHLLPNIIFKYTHQLHPSGQLAQNYLYSFSAEHIFS